jgi:hypothetical protein
LSEKPGSAALPLNQLPPGALWWGGVLFHGEGADSNSNRGIEPNTCIDSKACIAVKSCIARKKVFDTIAFKDC